MDDREFRRLLGDLGYDFEGYRRVRKGVKKRLRHHMHALGCRSLDDYLGRLAASRQVRAACIRRLAVPISRFFRDRPFWEALRDEWLPELRQRFPGPLAAWSAGCACGEEAYSLAMIDRESRTRSAGAAGKFTITATDLNPVVLARARAGIYPASSLREVPEDWKARYFVPLRRRYRFRSERFDPIRWQRRDIEAPVPEGPYHLVLLRNNVLTYCDPPRQARALKNVMANIAPGGLLAIGMNESLPEAVGGLKPASDTLTFLYRKWS